MQILCTAGCLWLTLDEDARDVVLYPGDSFEDASGRRALIYAFEASAFTLLAQRRSSGRPASARGSRFPIVWAATRTAVPAETARREGARRRARMLRACPANTQFMRIRRTCLCAT